MGSVGPSPGRGLQAQAFTHVGALGKHAHLVPQDENTALWKATTALPMPTLAIIETPESSDMDHSPTWVP